MKKIGRNDKCICGSGKKYKFCCMKKNTDDEADNNQHQKKLSLMNTEEREVDNFINIHWSFDNILKYIDNEWLMADILEISPTNNREILFREFEKKFGGIFNGDQHQRYELGTELFFRMDEVKKRIGKVHEEWYKGIYVIKDLSDYIKVLSTIKKFEGDKELWYRGQLDAKYHLTPNIFRNAREIGNSYGFTIKPKSVSWFARGQEVAFPNVKRMLEEFKEKVNKLVKFEINNDFEWMFLAQHYGMLTPLLDWSEDPLVALFFALDGLKIENRYSLDIEMNEFEKYGRISEAAAVYILDPGKLNENSIFYHKDDDGKKRFINYPVQINDKNIDTFRGYIDSEIICPLCIKAPKREYRICRQSGNFVCQGSNIQPIDSLGICRKVLYKIYIPYAVVTDIKKELEILNITSDAIYGEESYLDKYAKEIRSNEEKKFSDLIYELNLKYLTGEYEDE